MPTKSKSSRRVLAGILRGKLSKDPTLAAKQARLLERLKNATSAPCAYEPIDDEESAAFAKHRYRQRGPVADMSAVLDLEPLADPKSATELLLEGVPHKGFLAQISAAELTDSPDPATAALQLPLRKRRALQKRMQKFKRRSSC